MEDSPRQVPAPPKGMPGVPPASRWRDVLWACFAAVLVFPVVWVTGVFAVVEVYHFIPALDLKLPGLVRDGTVAVVPAVVAFAFACWVVRSGLRRRWSQRNALLTGWGVGAGVSLFLVAVGALSFRESGRTSKEKVVLSNLAAIRFNAQLYYQENGAIFVTYDELIGPTRHLKSLNPVMGEDYRPLFPIRQDHVEELRVTLPNGRVVSWGQPRDVPDGVVNEGSSLRFETTYRNGWPHGPARVWEKDGRLVSEANYVEGHIVGPCWFYRGGGKIDLNSPANRPSAVLGP
jgi:hypothetical protein